MIFGLLSSESSITTTVLDPPGDISAPRLSFGSSSSSTLNVSGPSHTPSSLISNEQAGELIIYNIMLEHKSGYCPLLINFIIRETQLVMVINCTL